MLARSPRALTPRAARSAVAVIATLAAFAACDLDQPTGVPGATPDNTSSATTGASSSSRAASVSATSSGTGGDDSVGGFAIAVDNPAPELDLAATVDLVVTLTPSGYAGDVALSVTDLSAAGITAALAAPTVTLDGATPVTTTLTLTTATGSTPGSTPVVVTATIPDGANEATANLLVRSAITITIPLGVDALGGTPQAPVTSAFGAYPMNIRAPEGLSAANPVTVRFFNADTVPHEIHADKADQGFGHGVLPIAPGAMDDIVREINVAGQYDYYLHEQGVPNVVGQIVIQ